jgi:nicotinamidase-related amidase
MNKPALLVIDLQNGFINKHTAHLPKKIKELLTSTQYTHKIFTKFVNQKRSPFENLIGWKEMHGPPDTEILEELKPHAKVLFEKNTYSCLTPQFLHYIETHQIHSFHLAGIDTDGCVLKSALDLFEKNLSPFILCNYCGSTGEKPTHNF